MKRAEKITGNWRKELTALFRQTRKDVCPYLDEYRMGDINVLWWIKPTGKQMGSSGLCYRGTWRVQLNNRSRWITNLILLDQRLLENPEELRDTWKHELVHLVGKSKGHDKLFSNLIRACGAHMYHNFNK